MCGICGVIQVAGEPRLPVSADVLDGMTDVMTHRGPDDRGTHLAPGVALGVRRLSIVDVGGGHQPVTSGDARIWAIQNGELYNHELLRSELEAAGHRFLSRCDTEVLPHLYERDGEQTPARLHGKFALAIWDERSRRALLARDRMGVKPLYVAQSGDLLVFASELKSVLASGIVSTELDFEAIGAYLTLGFFAGPTTPLKGVRKLLPGHRLIVADGRIRDEVYWQLPYPTGEAGGSEEELAERMLGALDEAVRLRLMSDVSLGSMLSGGLDSSVVTALMARHTTGPVKTFSVGFFEDREGNELADARLVASALGADHHELELSLADEAIPLQELAWHLDEPLADLSALGFHALSALAAQHVTVALSGQGADELFGGYPAHRNAAIAGRLQRLPRPARFAGRRLAAMAPRRYRRAAQVVMTDDPVARFVAQYTKIDDSEKNRLVRGPLVGIDGAAVAALVDRHFARRGGEPLADALYLSQQLGLVDDMLHYFDRASMAHSLEVRVPFLDHELIELVAVIPNRLKVDDRFGRKAILRRVAQGLIPDKIIQKQKVGFFSHAVEGWFRAQANGTVADWLLSGDAATAELFDQAEVHRLVHSFRRGEPANPRALLAVLMLEIWLADTLPRAVSAASAARRAAGSA
jgi:asparagine synthase (glutamine-hydrolysing)